MKKWNLDVLRKIDYRFSLEDIPMHQRPLKAAIEILGSSVSFESLDPIEVKKIVQAYKTVLPEADSSWPGAGIGLISSLDKTKKIVLPLNYGKSSFIAWKIAGFTTHKEYNNWCHNKQNIALGVDYAIADIYDLSMGLEHVKNTNTEAATYWELAQSCLEDLSNALPNLTSNDTIIQSIHMTSELSLKAALIYQGAKIKDIKSHDLDLLAKKIFSARRHRDDENITSVIHKMPHFVNSRYSSAGMTRLQVVKLAIGSQFIAASTLRRLTECDLSQTIEKVSNTGPRSLFTV